jgi:hypothetical protein
MSRRECLSHTPCPLPAPPHKVSASQRRQMAHQQALKQACGDARESSAAGHPQRARQCVTHAGCLGVASSAAQGMHGTTGCSNTHAHAHAHAHPHPHTHAHAHKRSPYKSLLLAPNRPCAAASVSSRLQRPALRSLMASRKSLNCAYDRRALLRVCACACAVGGWVGPVCCCVWWLCACSSCMQHDMRTTRMCAVNAGADTQTHTFKHTATPGLLEELLAIDAWRRGQPLAHALLLHTRRPAAAPDTNTARRRCKAWRRRGRSRC